MFKSFILDGNTVKDILRCNSSPVCPIDLESALNASIANLNLKSFVIP